MEDSDSGFFATQTIGIIGLGLIGGSYAKGLRRIGAGRIIAIDTDAAALRQAKADGVIDEGYTAGCRALGMADMLIFCTDTHAMIQFVRDNTLFFKSDVLLTDVAGIKGDTARIIRSLLTDTMDFVPCHPMAGREGRGYGMARHYRMFKKDGHAADRNQGIHKHGNAGRRNNRRPPANVFAPQAGNRAADKGTAGNA